MSHNRWFLVALHVAVFGLARAGHAQAQAGPPPATAYVIRGTVKSGNTVLPGAMVSASSDGQSEKYTTWTAVDGSYVLPIPGAGHYTLTTQMAAFASASRNVDVENVYTLVDFNVVLLSRSEQPKTEEHVQTPTSVGGNRGFRTLGVVQGENAQDLSSNEQAGAFRDAHPRDRG